MVLKMVLRVPTALEPEAPQQGLAFTGKQPERLTPARRQIMEFAEQGLSWTKSGLAHAAGVTPSVVDGLAKLGVMETIELPSRPLFPKPDDRYGTNELTPDQREKADELRTIVKARKAGATLLEGITGSGKTEVYFEALAECFAQGKQALVLLPEIALTSSFLERFEQRFGARPAEWHSELAPKARERTWRQVVTGDLQIVAGARSAWPIGRISSCALFSNASD